MTIYIIITVVLILVSFYDYIDIHKISRNFFIILINVFLICLSGFRFITGHDYYNYINIFNRITSVKQYLDGENAYSVEWGYALLNLFVKQLGGDAQIVFFIMAALTIIIFSFAISRYTKLYFSTFLMFYFTLYFENTMGHIRTGLAMAIVLCGIRYIEEQKLFKFLIIIFFAAAFHSTALVVIPVYFIRKYEPSSKFIFISLAAAFLIGNGDFIKEFIQFITSLDVRFYITNKILNYSGDEAVPNIFKTAVMRIGILSLFIYFKSSIESKLKSYKTLLYMYYFGVLFLLLLAKAPNDFTTRGTMMLAYVQIFILPVLVYRIKNIYIRVASYNLIIIYGFSLFFSYMTTYAYAFFPYRNIFMK